MAMGTRHRSCVGDSMDTWCPVQCSQVGATVGSGSQVGWRTRGCQKRDSGTNSGLLDTKLRVKIIQERSLRENFKLA